MLLEHFLEAVANYAGTVRYLGTERYFRCFKRRRRGRRHSTTTNTPLESLGSLPTPPHNTATINKFPVSKNATAWLILLLH